MVETPPPLTLNTAALIYLVSSATGFQHSLCITHLDLTLVEIIRVVHSKLPDPVPFAHLLEETLCFFPGGERNAENNGIGIICTRGGCKSCGKVGDNRVDVTPLHPDAAGTTAILPQAGRS